MHPGGGRWGVRSQDQSQRVHCDIIMRGERGRGPDLLCCASAIKYTRLSPELQQSAASRQRLLQARAERVCSSLQRPGNCSRAGRGCGGRYEVTGLPGTS